MAEYSTMIEALRDEAAMARAGDGHRMVSSFALNALANAIEELSMKLHGDEAAIAGMKREIERMVVSGKPRWIPVTERLPEEEKEVYWCYTNMGIMCECRWTNNRYGLGESDAWGWNIMDVPQYQRVTHWMPLPEPPKEET